MGSPRAKRVARDRYRVKQSPVRLASGESVAGGSHRGLVALADERSGDEPRTLAALREELLLTVASASEIRVISAGTAGAAFPTQTLGEPCFETRRSLTRGELGSGASAVTSPQRVTECS
jgi:hypothetical protein